ncbi:MAG: radical SAM protein [Spirochaetia bacterium]
MSFSSPLLAKVHNLYKDLETKHHDLQYLFLEITRKCNLACRHCGSDCTSENAEKQLTTESWVKIIHTLAEEYGKQLSFVLTGGEPLMHPELERITKALSETPNQWGLVTNGLLLNKRKLYNLLDRNITSLTISLDGPAEQHDFLRGSKGAFQKALAAIKLTGESGIGLWDAVTCVYPGSLEYLDETAEILLERGCKNWRIFRIFPSGRAKENRDLSLSFDQTTELIDWIKKARKKYAKKGLHLQYSCEGWVPFETDRQIRDFPFFCRSGINFASVLVDGSITGCSNNHPSFIQGNIVEDSFRFLWENRFTDFRSKDWLGNTVCGECEYLAYCRGGSMHLWEKGGKSPGFCYVREVR